MRQYKIYIEKIFEILGFDKSKIDSPLETSQHIKLAAVLDGLKKVTPILKKNQRLTSLEDFATTRIVAVSNYDATIQALRDEYSLIPKWGISGVKLFITTVLPCDPADYYQFTLQSGSRYTKSFDGLNGYQLYRYKLVQEKVNALDIIHSAIIYRMNLFCSDLPLQQYIYQEKKRQAIEVLKLTDNIDPLEYPMISGYASVRCIDIKEAAQEIQLVSNSINHSLANLENIRIKYTRMIRDEYDITKINQHLNNFHNEFTNYAQV